MYDAKRWLPTTIQKVWQKAVWVSAENEVRGFRRDVCGAWIQFNQHGNRNGKYGWEIDHINPVARGGLDIFDNLQPLHWENNVGKGDSTSWNCAVRG